MRVTKEDGADLGLVRLALIRNAITLDEAIVWACSVVADTDAPHEAFFALMDAETKLDWMKHGAWGYDDTLGRSQSDALRGLAYLRGMPFDTRHDDETPEDVALRALKTNPELVARLRRVMPLADLPKETV